MAQNSNQFFPSMPGLPNPGMFPTGGPSVQPVTPSAPAPPPIGSQWGSMPTGPTGTVTGGGPMQQNNQPSGVGPYGQPPATYNALGSGSNPYAVTNPNTGGGVWQVNSHNGIYETAPLNQQFTGGLYNWLGSQIGAGIPGFNLSTSLATGGQTNPGELNAPLNPIMQQLMTMLGGGQSTSPGANTLSNIANNGISALPEWQSMIAAQQQNIQQNQANLKEQFAGQGTLAGTPYGNAMSNYMTQTTADQNSMLGQLQQQNILQGQIPVAQGLQNMASGTGQYLQSLNQGDIQNVLNEFNATLPQFNPLNNEMLQAGLTFPPTMQLGKGGGTLAGLIPGAASGVAAGAGAAADGGGLMESLLAGLAAF